MPDTAALVVALSAQLTKFEKDMQKATEIADTHVKKIENSFANANIQVGGLSEFGDKLARLLTIGGILEMARQLAELNEQVAKLGEHAEALGTTSTYLQQLNYAAAATGSSVDKMSSFLDQFSRKVGEAAQGSGALYNFLQVNGIAAEKFAKIPLNEQLAKYADLIKGLKSPQEQINALAIASGRNFADLLSVFKEGADGLRKFTDEAGKFGVIMDESMVKKAQEINKEYQVLKLQLQIFFEQLAISAAGAGKTVARNAEESSKQVEGWVDTFRKKVEETFPGMEKKIVDFFKTANDEIEKSQKSMFATPPVIQRRGTEILDYTLGGDSRLKKSPDVIAAENAEKLTNTYNAQAEEFRKLIQAQEKRTQLLTDEALHVGESAGKQAEYKTQIELTNQVIEKNRFVTEQQKVAIAAAAKATGEAAQQAYNARQQWQGLNEAVQFAGNQMIDIMIGLTQRTLTAQQAMTQLTNALVKALLQAALLGSGPLGNILGFGATSPGGTGGLGGLLTPLIKGLLPARQGGGPVYAGNAYIVGEHGKELFVPGQTGQVVPGQVNRGGGGGGIQVITNNYASKDTETTTRQTSGPNTTQVVIDIVKKAQARGDFDDVNRGRYGLRANKVR